MEFAEYHFTASTLFDPEIAEMIMASDQHLSSKNINFGKGSPSKDDDMDTSENDTNDKYATMSEDLDSKISAVD